MATKQEISIELVCIPIIRQQRSKTYEPSNYSIGILNGRDHSYGFITLQVDNKLQDFNQLIHSTLREEHNISPLSVHEMTITSSGDTNINEVRSTISIVYAIPTVNNGDRGTVEFLRLSELLKKPFLLQSGSPKKDVLLAINDWLLDIHNVSDPELLYKPDTSGHSLLGTLQCTVSNPLHDANISSEDSLIIGVNNPIFKPVTNTT